MSLANLRVKVASLLVFGQLFRLEELRRSFKKHGREIRAAIDDQFRSWFQRELTLLETHFSNAETNREIAGLEEAFRKEWMREGLNIVSETMNPSDLALVRQSLASGLIASNQTDIKFIAKHGEWQDIPILLSYLDARRAESRTIFAPAASLTDTTLVARALCGLARKRLRELLIMEMDVNLRASVISSATNASFRSLRNSEILGFMRDSSDTLRRTVALKCVICLTKSRLSTIFESYMASEADRYYNVLTWLDLGMSAERSFATDIARRAILERH